jgi:hypothetical protein
MITSTPGVPAIMSDKICVAYDPRTGDIVHIHRVTTLEGAEIPSEESIRACTLRHAENRLQISQTCPAETMFAEPRHFHPAANHKVDLDTRKLIVIPRDKRTFSQE